MKKIKIPSIKRQINRGRNVSGLVPGDVDEKLESLKEKTGQTKSYIVGMIITEFIDCVEADSGFGQLT